MGKIGDLFVRLGLKSDDFKKGMDDAKKQTEGFGSKLSKMKGVAVAAWAAMGAAAMKFAKDVIMSTNRTGDAWEMFIAKSKAGWNTFLQTLSSWNWDNWIGRIKEATAAAKELQSALDASFEIKNSIELQKAAMAEELANLQILMHDVSKPWEVRKQAAEDYLDKIKTIFDQEKALANKLLDAQQGKWLAGTGLTDNEQTRTDLAKFMVDYGKQDNEELLNALAFVRNHESKKGTRQRNRKSFIEQVRLADKYSESKKIISDFEQSNGYQSGSLLGLSKAYENLRGDKDTEPLIQAMIGSYNANAAEAESTRRVHAVINQAEAQAQADIEKFNATLAGDLQAGLDAAFDEIDAFDDSFADIELEIKPLDITKFEKSKDQIIQSSEEIKAAMERAAEYGGMIEDAIISSTMNSMQALTDMMFGLEDADMKNVLAAFLSPFADTMKQMGAMIMAEGIAMEAFKKSIANPYAAIAAGAALIAVGSAVSSGLQKLTANPTGGGTSASSAGASSTNVVQNYESTLTIEVTGKISGSDILISGQKTQNKWNR